MRHGSHGRRRKWAGIFRTWGRAGCRMEMTGAHQGLDGRAETVLATSRWARCWRLAVAGVVGLAFFGPVLVTFASSSPATARTFAPPNVAISVHPFEDLNTRSCMPGLPLHVGPVQWVGRLTDQNRLQGRMTAAMASCTTASSGGVELGVTVDIRGQITRISTEPGDDPVVAACVARLLHRDAPKTVRGPGTLRIGYFMGRLPGGGYQ